MPEVKDVPNLFRKKDFQGIKQLIHDEPAVIHEEFGQGNLLALSVAVNQFDLVQLLFEMKAPALSHNDLVVLWLRSGTYDNPPCLRILGLLINNGHSFPSSDDCKGCRLVNYHMSPIYAHDDINVLTGMIDLGFDPVITEQSGQCSMIARSILKGDDENTKIADALLSLGCSVEALENDSHSPVAAALSHRLYGFVAKLLDHGASTSRLEDIAQDLAPHLGIPEDLRNRLLEGRMLNWVDEDGATPIHRAVFCENSGYISYLLENGGDINLSTSIGTPLIYAINSDREHMAKLLVKLGADVNAMLNDETALDRAMARPGLEVTCEMLDKAGAKTSLELDGVDCDRAVIVSIKKSIQPGEVWANEARKNLCNAGGTKAVKWDLLIRHCLDNSSTKPSSRWLKQADALVDEIGATEVRALLLRWFPLVKEKRVGDISEVSDEYYDECYGGSDHVISENNTRLLKGLIWIAQRFSDSETSRALRQLAADMYRKVFGVGMRNAKLANAAVLSLSSMPGNVGLREIVLLRAATKYNPALVHINRVFDKLAESTGKTADELAELATPDYGLTDIGEYRETIGDFEVRVNLVSVGKCELIWQGKAKTQKSVPAALKNSHAEEVKAVKALKKDVETGSSAHSQRIEAMYLRRNELDYGTWTEQYVNHKLIGFLARRLIWRVSHSQGTMDVIFFDAGFMTHDERFVEVPADSSLSLWHPSMSSPSEVLSWRSLLIRKEITQPFKQAHREIYLLTDAERETRDHSLRFADHIMKHSQFHALAGHRGWTQQRGGSWDGGSENSAYKTVPAFGISVSFEAEGAESYGISDTGIYECVASGEVVFAKGKRLDLKDVAPLLFSEIMRDVDLFVGVTGIGNDPDWRDRENHHWSSTSFGELNQMAATRKDVLQALIPKLKIAGQLKLEGKFLVVEGKLRTYKIHLGSSNILMEPNDSYLCIVEVRSKSNVMLPFEGDHTLSLILSKAMMLADDHKIKDQTILSQIRHAEALANT